jgi:Crinkler effector protein N-terminal domain
MSVALLRLRCYVPGSILMNTFGVVIDKGSSVAALVDVIREKNSETFSCIDVTSIILWKVAIPFHASIEDDIKNLKLDHKTSLRRDVILLDIFESTPARDIVSIIASTPSFYQPDLPVYYRDGEFK